MGNSGDGGKSTRFKPGQSGNPKGRPRKVKSPQTQSAFEVLRQRRITVRMEGVDRELTVDEALLQRTLEDAFAGSRMATRTILRLIEEQEAVQAPSHRRFAPFRVEWLTPQSVDEALTILGIASRSTEGVNSTSRGVLELEPWAVASGLERRKGQQLSDHALADLKAHTRHSADIVCPEDKDE